tara:strand:- start:69 stop:446 length:378 start_codon:yes stop_codon:yes gene_type:complete
MKKIINTINAPSAVGHYSQAILVDNTLYCSGQIAINPEDGKLVLEDIETETDQVIKNCLAVLKAANMDFKNVVKCTIFIKNMQDYNKINNIYGTHFTSNFPAREVVEVAALPKNVNIEISIIAHK